MRKIPVSTLSDGAYFDKPVFLDERFVLLAPDAPAREVRSWFSWKTDAETIERLVAEGRLTRPEPGLLAIP